MDANPTQRSQFQAILSALSHRNYRLFFTGQCISVLGTWMQLIAVKWLVFYLTGSAFMLGMVVFVTSLPLLLLGPIAGVWVDRWDRRRTLLVTQSLFMLQALTLAALALTGAIAVWHILVLSTLAGTINALDGSVRSALMPELVETKDDLASAIALSSFTQNCARMLGPPLAGGLIALLQGEIGVVEATGVCFLVNGVSYVAVCAALLAMTTAPLAAVASHHGPLWEELREGVAYAFREPPIRALLLIQVLVSLVGMQSALLPVVASDLLGGGASTLGWLMGFSGLGSLAGALFLAARRGVHGALGRIAFAGLALGVAMIAFSFSRQLWISLTFLAAIGFAMLVIMVASSTLLQMIVADDKRGRVTSLFLLAAWGMTALGSLLLGSLADAMGVAATLLLAGACCLVGFLCLAARISSLRPLVELGDPETANLAPAHRSPLSEAHHP